LALAALVATPALATVRYEAKTSSGGDGMEESIIFVEGYVNGLNTKVFFRDSDNQWMKAGFYLVSTDGGKTLFMVNPEEETFSEWDLEQVLRFAGAMMQGLGPIVNFKIENARVDLISEGPGESMHGLSTRLSELESEYDMLLRVIGIKKASHIQTQSKIWTTKGVEDIAMSVWLRNDPPEIGYDEFDKLVRTAWGSTEGVTLKMEQTSTTTGKKGKTQRNWSKFLVTSLDQSASDPEGGYGWPDHYTRVDMMPTEAQLSGDPNAGGDEGGDKKKKKRFGLFDGGS
jgi:hypothetical protein